MVDPVSTEGPRAQAVLAARTFRRVGTVTPEADLRKVVPAHLRTERQPAAQQLRQLETGLRRLVAVPRQRRRCFEYDVIVRVEAAITGAEREPARAGNHVAE